MTNNVGGAGDNQVPNTSTTSGSGGAQGQTSQTGASQQDSLAPSGFVDVLGNPLAGVSIAEYNEGVIDQIYEYLKKLEELSRESLFDIFRAAGAASSGVPSGEEMDTAYEDYSATASQVNALYARYGNFALNYNAKLQALKDRADELHAFANDIVTFNFDDETLFLQITGNDFDDFDLTDFEYAMEDFNKTGFAQFAQNLRVPPLSERGSYQTTITGYINLGGWSAQAASALVQLRNFQDITPEEQKLVLKEYGAKLGQVYENAPFEQYIDYLNGKLDEHLVPFETQILNPHRGTASEDSVYQNFLRAVEDYNAAIQDVSFSAQDFAQLEQVVAQYNQLNALLAGAGGPPLPELPSLSGVTLPTHLVDPPSTLPQDIIDNLASFSSLFNIPALSQLQQDRLEAVIDSARLPPDLQNLLETYMGGSSLSFSEQKKVVEDWALWISDPQTITSEVSAQIQNALDQGFFSASIQAALTGLLNQGTALSAAQQDQVIAELEAALFGTRLNQTQQEELIQAYVDAVMSPSSKATIDAFIDMIDAPELTDPQRAALQGFLDSGVFQNEQTMQDRITSVINGNRLLHTQKDEIVTFYARSQLSSQGLANADTFANLISGSSVTSQQAALIQGYIDDGAFSDQLDGWLGLFISGQLAAGSLSTLQKNRLNHEFSIYQAGLENISSVAQLEDLLSLSTLSYEQETQVQGYVDQNIFSSPSEVAIAILFLGGNNISAQDLERIEGELRLYIRDVDGLNDPITGYEGLLAGFEDVLSPASKAALDSFTTSMSVPVLTSEQTETLEQLLESGALSSSDNTAIQQILDGNRITASMQQEVIIHYAQQLLSPTALAQITQFENLVELSFVSSAEKDRLNTYLTLGLLPTSQQSLVTNFLAGSTLTSIEKQTLVDALVPHDLEQVVLVEPYVSDLNTFDLMLDRFILSPQDIATFQGYIDGENFSTNFKGLITSLLAGQTLTTFEKEFLIEEFFDYRLNQLMTQEVADAIDGLATLLDTPVNDLTSQERLLIRGYCEDGFISEPLHPLVDIFLGGTELLTSEKEALLANFRTNQLELLITPEFLDATTQFGPKLDRAILSSQETAQLQGYIDEGVFGENVAVLVNNFMNGQTLSEPEKYQITEALHTEYAKHIQREQLAQILDKSILSTDQDTVIQGYLDANVFSTDQETWLEDLRNGAVLSASQRQELVYAFTRAQGNVDVDNLDTILSLVSLTRPQAAILQEYLDDQSFTGSARTAVASLIAQGIVPDVSQQTQILDQLALRIAFREGLMGIAELQTIFEAKNLTTEQLSLIQQYKNDTNLSQESKDILASLEATGIITVTQAQQVEQDYLSNKLKQPHITQDNWEEQRPNFFDLIQITEDTFGNVTDVAYDKTFREVHDELKAFYKLVDSAVTRARGQYISLDEEVEDLIAAVESDEGAQELPELNQFAFLNAEEFRSYIIQSYFGTVSGETSDFLEQFISRLDSNIEEGSYNDLKRFLKNTGSKVANANLSSAGSALSGLGNTDYTVIAKILQQARSKEILDVDNKQVASIVQEQILSELDTFFKTIIGVSAVVGVSDAFSVANQFTFASTTVQQQAFALEQIDNLNNGIGAQYQERMRNLFERLAEQTELGQEMLDRLKEFTMDLMNTVIAQQSLAIAQSAGILTGDFTEMSSAYFAKIVQDSFDAIQRAEKESNMTRERVEEIERRERILVDQIQDQVRLAALEDFEGNRDNLYDSFVRAVGDYNRREGAKEEGQVIQEEDFVVLFSAVEENLRGRGDETVGALLTQLPAALETSFPNINSTSLAHSIVLRFTQNDAEFRVQRDNAFVQNDRLNLEQQTMLTQRLQDVLFGQSFVQHLEFFAQAVEGGSARLDEAILLSKEVAKEYIQGENLEDRPGMIPGEKVAMDVIGKVAETKTFGPSQRNSTHFSV